MHRSIWLSGAAILFLAACETGSTGTTQRSGQFIQNLPEAVLAIAAPYQDLSAVRIDPANGCFVYRHVGPVETTFLPLRSVKGRPICKKAADPA
jgi:hypothetical protein